MSEEVTVLVVSWGRADLTGRFLRSVPDDTPCMWWRNETRRDRDRMDLVGRNHHHHVEMFHSKRNIGFAGAVNRLMASVATRFALVCNSDIVLGQRAAERIAAEWTDDLGVLGCLTDRGGPQHYEAARRNGPITPWAEGLKWREYDEFLMTAEPLERHTIAELALSFSCVLFSREAWSTVGSLDESLGLAYGEDNDWCHRARLAGLTVAFTPNVLVHHDHGGSTDTTTERRLRRRGLEALTEKWGQVV